MTTNPTHGAAADVWTSGGRFVHNSDDEYVCQCREPEQAEQIVREHNSHAQLLAALEKCRMALEDVHICEEWADDLGEAENDDGSPFTKEQRIAMRDKFMSDALDAVKSALAAAKEAK